MPIRGHVVAIKSGHRLNLELLKKFSQHIGKTHLRGQVNWDDWKEGQVYIDKIMKILPHRYPFLLVDRVLKVEKGKRAIGIKNVTINDNFFQGHFPSRPMMPGVLIVEAMAQAAGIAALTDEKHQGKVALFMGVDKAKFRRIVVPGDQLWMEVEVIRDRTKAALVKGVAKVAGEIAAEAEMLFSFTDASFLD
jgi:beta-hydroxyacyl-ACP dehydratase FabZ